MSRAVRFYETGGPEVLRLEDLADDALRDGEVRLRILAFGLNRSECQLRDGSYPMMGARFPTRLGREACGIVEEVAANAPADLVGRRVTTIAKVVDVQRYGVYGERAIVPLAALAPWPEPLDPIGATAVWQQYLTAYGPLVELGRLEAGQWVLVTAAASSVGHAALQIVNALGGQAIATTRDAAKAAHLRAAGAAHGIVVGADTDIAAEAMKITGDAGVSLVLDPVAGPGLERLAAAAAPGATIFLYGQLDPTPAPFPVVPVLRKGLAFRGYTLWEIVLDEALLARAQDWILTRIADGTLRPKIDRVFELDEIVEAHRYMESNRQMGKIVVRVDRDAAGARNATGERP